MSKRILYLGLDPTHYETKGEITHWPIIQIVARPLSDFLIDQALRDFDLYSHILITSKSTVPILQDYLSCLGIESKVWAKKATLAVGKITARYLHACGITPLRVAQKETAEGLVEELQQLCLSEDAHVFWPHSSQSRSIIKDYLVARNVRHTTCVLYDPQPRISTTLPVLENFDEIVFTSPSTIDVFLSIFGQFPLRISLTPIGPVTAQYLDSIIDLLRNL